MKTRHRAKQQPPRRLFGVTFNSIYAEDTEPNDISDNPAFDPDADPGFDLSLWRVDYDAWLREGNWTVTQIAARIVDRLKREASEDVPLQETVPLEALGLGASLCGQVAELVNREVPFVSFGSRA